MISSLLCGLNKMYLQAELTGTADSDPCPRASRHPNIVVGEHSGAPPQGQEQPQVQRLARDWVAVTRPLGMLCREEGFRAPASGALGDVTETTLRVAIMGLDICPRFRPARLDPLGVWHRCVSTPCLLSSPYHNPHGMKVVPSLLSRTYKWHLL